jgi:hypothetical protein
MVFNTTFNNISVSFICGEKVVPGEDQYKKTTAIFFVNLFEMTLNFNTKLECRMCPYK